MSFIATSPHIRNELVTIEAVPWLVYVLNTDNAPVKRDSLRVLLTIGSDPTDTSVKQLNTKHVAVIRKCLSNTDGTIQSLASRLLRMIKT